MKINIFMKLYLYCPAQAQIMYWCAGEENLRKITSRRALKWTKLKYSMQSILSNITQDTLCKSKEEDFTFITEVAISQFKH